MSTAPDSTKDGGTLHGTPPLPDGPSFGMPPSGDLSSMANGMAAHETVSKSGDEELALDGSGERKMSTRFAYNSVKSLITCPKALKDHELKALARASSMSMDSLASAMLNIKNVDSDTAEKTANEIYTKINRRFTTITTRIDHGLPIVAALDSFPVRESKSSFKPFTGDGDEDWAIWLRRFNDLINMAPTKLTDAQKAVHLIGNLAGRARDAVDTLSDTERAVYATLVEKVVSLMDCPEERALARQKLCSCRQETGESVQVFFTRLQRIVRSVMHGRDADLVSERLLEEFIDRLVPKISFHVKTRVPTTVEDAFMLAKRYESLLTDMASSMITHGMLPDVQASQVTGKHEWNHEAPSYTQHQYGGCIFKKGLFCHKCGDEGHFKWECSLSNEHSSHQLRQVEGSALGQGHHNSNGHYWASQQPMIPFQPVVYYSAPTQYACPPQQMQPVYTYQMMMGPMQQPTQMAPYHQ